MKTLLQFLADQLHYANAVAGFAEFYAVKDRVLKRWGSLVGHDLQLFEGKPCWNCNSRDAATGDWRPVAVMPEGWSPDTHECYRCSDSGWYRYPAYVVLERYVFGGHVFHRPLARPVAYVNGPPEVPARLVIRGRIEKRGYGRKSANAVLLLMLLFDTPYGLRIARSRVWYSAACQPLRRLRNWWVCTGSYRWRYEWRLFLVEHGLVRKRSNEYYSDPNEPGYADDLPF